jgi:hypothetical protein
MSTSLIPHYRQAPDFPSPLKQPSKSNLEAFQNFLHQNIHQQVVDTAQIRLSSSSYVVKLTLAAAK